jgi:hypothetical protein
MKRLKDPYESLDREFLDLDVVQRLFARLKKLPNRPSKQVHDLLQEYLRDEHVPWNTDANSAYISLDISFSPLPSIPVDAVTLRLFQDSNALSHLLS